MIRRNWLLPQKALHQHRVEVPDLSAEGLELSALVIKGRSPRALDRATRSALLIRRCARCSIASVTRDMSFALTREENSLPAFPWPSRERVVVRANEVDHAVAYDGRAGGLPPPTR